MTPSKKKGLNGKVIDERCHMRVHGCVLKGQVSSNHEPAPQGDPELVHMHKYSLYFSVQKKINNICDG